MPGKPFSLEHLKDVFDKALFPVKDMAYQDDGFFRFEYNYPHEKAANAMRYAMRKNGAIVMTYYDIQERSERRGDVLARERVLVPYEKDNHEDLRSFFNDVIDLYMDLMDELSLNDDSPYAPKSVRRRSGLGRR